jgi:hypothetical protein
MIVLTLPRVGTLQATPEWENPLSSSDSLTNVSRQTLIQQSVRFLSLLPPITDVHPVHNEKLGVEFGSKLITIPEEDKVVKLQCVFLSYQAGITPPAAPPHMIPYHDAHPIRPPCRLGYRRNGILSFHHAFLLPRCCRLPPRLRRHFAPQYVLPSPPPYPVADANANAV